MAQSVSDVMIKDPVALPATSTLQEAAVRMRDDGIGDVLVLDDDERLRGIVTDRDLAIRAVAEGRDPSNVTVGELCSGDVVTLSPEDTVEDAVRRMRDAAVRRMPVLDGNRPVGILSLGDLAIERDPGSALGDISAAPPNT